MDKLRSLGGLLGRHLHNGTPAFKERLSGDGMLAAFEQYTVSLDSHDHHPISSLFPFESMVISSFVHDTDFFLSPTWISRNVLVEAP